MKRLLLALVILISAKSLHSMDPTSLYELRRTGPILDLPVELEKFKQSCANSKSLVTYIKALIDSHGYQSASKLCEQFFYQEEISICDIQDTLYQNTSLHCAVASNYLDVAQILIQITGHDVWSFLVTKNRYREIALHLAAHSNNTDMLKLLLSAAGNKAWKLLTFQDADGDTPLHYAARYKKTENIKLFLEVDTDKTWALFIIRNIYKKTFFDMAHPETKEIMKSYMITDK